MEQRVGKTGSHRRLLGRLDRREVVAGIVGLLPASLVRAVAAAPEAEVCLGIGARCGRKRQPPCNRCCAGHTSKPAGRPQRRCACRPLFVPCRRSDQCCSGLCESVSCEGDERVCIPFDPFTPAC
jgi:hypothetical protein